MAKTPTPPPPSDAQIAGLIESLAPPVPPRAEPSIDDPLPMQAAAVSTAAAVPVAPLVDETATMGPALTAQLVAAVERLFERADRQEEGSAELLRQVLAQHGAFLKQTLAAENKLHPDISDLNPLGERDNPRPRLLRPCFFLGVPLEQPSLTRDEIELLNSFSEPLELPEKKWRVAFLRDGGGGEALYISVPFKGFDDLRGLSGGWQGVLRELKGDGAAPVSQDSLLKRIAALERIIAGGFSLPSQPSQG